VHLEEVDVVGAEPAQAGLGAADDVVPGQSRVVLPVAHRHPHLGGDQPVATVAAECLTEDLLGQPRGVDVGRVDQVDAELLGDRDLLAGPGHVDRADRAGPAGAAETHRAQSERRDAQATAPELPVLHASSPSL
jgi:hypothetical protein